MGVHRLGHLCEVTGTEGGGGGRRRKKRKKGGDEVSAGRILLQDWCRAEGGGLKE